MFHFFFRPLRIVRLPYQALFVTMKQNTLLLLRFWIWFLAAWIILSFFLLTLLMTITWQASYLNLPDSTFKVPSIISSHISVKPTTVDFWSLLIIINCRIFGGSFQSPAPYFHGTTLCNLAWQETSQKNLALESKYTHIHNIRGCVWSWRQILHIFSYSPYVIDRESVINHS